MHGDVDFYVRLGEFRKALSAEGLHGHYNLFQTWFGEEADQGDQVIRETRRRALVDAARAVCGGCARNKPVVENEPGHWVHLEEEGGASLAPYSICMCGTTIQPMIAALDAESARSSSRTVEEREIDELVDRFTAALRAKLKASEKKHGWSGAWKDISWRPTLLYAIREHVDKGDPRDVAAYCAFAWHHGWSLSDDDGEDHEARTTKSLISRADFAG